MSAYSGTDNLETMRLATNYNSFLSRLVLSRAAGARRALDFGAGVGTFALEMRSAGLEVECVEPDPSQRARLESQGFRSYASADEVESESFDFIYTLNVLEHIEDDVAALAALRRALRPGGTLFAYVPAFNCIYSSMDKKVGHFRRYRKGELVAKTKTAGLESLGAEYADSLGFAASLAYKMKGAESGGDLDPRQLVLYDRAVFPISRALDLLGCRFVVGKNVHGVFQKPVRGIS